ncbi:MAG: DUF3152 domain-containing protein [Candidatus Saccharimonadales bacterium]
MKRYLHLRALGLLLALCSVALGSFVIVQAADPTTASCKSIDPFCFAPQLQTTPARLETVTVPKIATPAWLVSPAPQPAAREVTYMVATKGTITANVDEFTSQVNQTLNSFDGWARLGIRFVRVETGGQFTVWLSEGSQVPTFSPSGCDAVVSCTVGNNVIINEIRWLNGSDAWNGAGGSLRDYRHMVVNHETGHWLGHGHEYCSGAGQAASVMQQQTIDMQGCKPNPWPLSHELYAPKLGIRS